LDIGQLAGLPATPAASGSADSAVGDESVPLRPRDLIPSTNGKKRRGDSEERETESTTDSESDAPTTCIRTITQSRKRQKRDVRDLNALADKLINKVQSGQRKRRKREEKGFAVFAVDDAVTECLRRNADDPDLDKNLDAVDTALKGRMKHESAEGVRRAWNSWYHLNCYRVIIDLRRKGRKRRSVRGVKVANSIVNHLLVSDGENAMGVLDGLAGKDDRRRLWTQADC